MTANISRWIATDPSRHPGTTTGNIDANIPIKKPAWTGYGFNG